MNGREIDKLKNWSVFVVVALKAIIFNVNVLWEKSAHAHTSITVHQQIKPRVGQIKFCSFVKANCRSWNWKELKRKDIKTDKDM